MKKNSHNEGEVIRTENLTKVYDRGAAEVRAINGVSLTIRHNEYCAIMGPSGSGKSTLMNVIGCLDVPTTGRYFLDGEEVSRLTEDELAEIRNHKIGFVFQTFHLLGRSSAVRNVELPMVYAGVRSTQRRQRAIDILGQVGLGERKEHLPNEMSGGERQRVAIARALANQPAILLADEPTGNLDTSTSGEIMKLLDDLHETGITIILVTHDPEVGVHAQRTIHFRDGVIESDTGSPTEPREAAP